MTRQRQKQEGKRKGYGKFLPVKKRKLRRFAIYELVQGSVVRTWTVEAETRELAGFAAKKVLGNLPELVKEIVEVQP